MKKSYINKPIIFGLLSLISILAFAKQEKMIQIFRNGEVIQEYNAADIDYIEVNDLIPAPENVNATVSNDQITIKWNPVEGATYNVYRAPDNTNFTLLVSNLKETSYTDLKPLRGSNFYRVKAVVGEVESGYTSSAAATLASEDMDNGVYLGISGFNQTTYDYPVLRLSDSSVEGFRTFIDGLTMKNGTLLYYSVDQALSTMQSTQLPSDISTAAIVTFTDGLDQGSMMMDVPYQDNSEYLDAINRRITTETVCGQPITAYSIGIRGQDVADVNMFQNNLKKLASSDANAFEVSSMAEVNAKFKEIAEQLSKSNYIQTINLKMPGVANGTTVRFTFDNVNSAEKSKLYIEGKFNLKSRSLEEVKYVGMSSTSGSTIKGVQEGIFVNFSIEGVHTDDNILINSKFTDEWTYIESNSSWQINSEFDKTENSDIVTERSSAVIMLVLDCSSSLGSQFSTAQNNAKDFINTLYEATGGDLGSGNDPGGNDNTIYSTTPKDLTLAVWKDGTRYFLTADQYKNANLADAIIEGLTVIFKGEKFILALKDIHDADHSRITNLSTVMDLYKDILPSKEQGIIISTRMTDIDNALIRFGGRRISLNPTYTSATYINSSGYYIDCIYGSGGSLGTYSRSPYIRPCHSMIDNEPIVWEEPDNLKLSVIIKGERVFLNEMEYQNRINEIDEKEGILIIGAGKKFVVQLTDAQSDPISNITTAEQFYGDIMPTAEQGKIISAFYGYINSKLTYFGGTTLNCTYTSATLYSSPFSCYTNCIYGSGGYLSNSAYAPYVRGVITLKSETNNN